MLPQPQLVPIIFEGLDTFTDPRRGIPAKLDLLENGYVSTPLKIQKRPGFTSQSKSINGGGSIASGAKLSRLGNEEVLSDGSYLYARSSATANWLKKAKMPSGSVYQDKLTGDAISSVRLNTTGAYNAGVLLYAWQGRSVNSITWRTVDSVTGGVLASGTFNGTVPKALACGSFLFLSSLDTSTGTIHVRKVDPASPTTIGAPTVVNTAATTTNYDVTVDTGTPQLLYAYYTSATTDTIHIRTVSTAPSVSADAPFSPAAGAGAAGPISWLWHDYSNGKAYLSVYWSVRFLDIFDVTTSTRAVTLTTNYAIGGPTPNAMTGYFETAGSTRNVLTEVPGASPDKNVINIWPGVGGGGSELMRSCLLSSKMFKQGGRYYFAASYEDTSQRSRFLVEYEHGTNGANGGTAIVGFLGSADDGGVSGGFSSTTSWQNICDPINFGSSSWGLPWHYSFTLGATYGVQSHRVTFSEANISPPERFADVLFVPGLQLNIYDGTTVTEQGFYLKPQAPALANGAVGGGKTPGGAYTVRLVYRWTAGGRIWRSPVGPSTQIGIGGATTSIQVTANTLRLTNKCARFNISSAVQDVVIEAYCTIAGGSTFYLDGTAINSVAADTVVFNLTTSDITLQANELLYQQSGVLSNDPIPAVRLVKTFGTRLFACVSHGDVWYSKGLSEGDGAHFSAVFRMPLDVSDGDVTALMDMDQSFMMGQRNGVYLLGGGDPTDTGQSLFGQPARINTTIGPIDQVSVVRLPTGIGYNSPRGIHVITRGLDSQFIGAPVQRYTLADTITGAVALDSRNHAAWTTSNGDLLVYDYSIGQWAVWTGLAAVACTLSSNVLAILASDGTVKVETPGTFRDDSTDIVMKVRTSWLSLAGFGGYQRLWDVLVVGEDRGAHQLQMSFAYNQSAFTNETLIANAGAATYDTGIEGGYVWEAQPKQQLCTAVQITIQDVVVTASTEAFYLTGIALNIGVLPGGARLPVTKSLA